MLNKIWKQYVYVFLIIWYLTRTISTKYMYMMKKKLLSNLNWKKVQLSEYTSDFIIGVY